jgi:uncharacterized membrane protein
MGTATLTLETNMRRIRRVLVFLPCLALLVAIGPPAAAQDSAPLPDQFQVTTDYPSIAVQAGDTVSVDLEVLAPSQQEAVLEIIDPPAGWTTILRGGGFVIEGVTAAPVTPPRVELEITVPVDTSPGDYVMGVQGVTETQSDLLNLTIQVADTPVGAILLEPSFQELRGRADDTFRFDLQVTNQRPEELTLRFDAVGPEGWNITAGPASEERASAVTVAAGASESVNVVATPSPTTAAGEYPIELTASAGGGNSATLALTAIVTGQATLELVPATERLDISGTAGEVVEATVFVTNSGSAEMESVSLSSSSRIWSRTSNTSEWAFSISSRRTTVYGRRRTASVSWPPSS